MQVVAIGDIITPMQSITLISIEESTTFIIGDIIIRLITVGEFIIITLITIGEIKIRLISGARGQLLIGDGLLKGMIKRKELFPGRLTTQQEVDSIITSQLSHLSQYDLTQFLFLSAKFSKKNNRRIKIDLVPRHLETIGSCLKRFPTSSWTERDIVFTINSLQAVRSNDVGVTEFLILLTSVVSESLKDSREKTKMNAQ